MCSIWNHEKTIFGNDNKYKNKLQSFNFKEVIIRDILQVEDMSERTPILPEISMAIYI